MRITAIVTTLLLAAAVAFAQTTPAQGNPTQSQTPGQPPAGQASGAAQAAPAQAAPANGGHRVLQAKSQDELKAYQDAMSQTDPAQAQAAADAFATKYPDSELRVSLYMRAMNLYAQANNSDKVIEVGRKAIAADPTNPVPLVQVASTLAETTRETDLDKEQRLAEAAKDAHAAIDNVDTGLLVPANADPERVAAAKRSILTMAYDTLGTVDINRTDYAAAETNLQKAINQSQGNPEAVLYLRLSVAQDKLQQYPQALESANKAVQYAKDGSAAQNLAKQQQARLQKLINSGSQTPGASAPMASPTAPVPGAQPGSPVPAPGSALPH
jgi:tetratricopeptide (TPR) repeat protein